MLVVTRASASPDARDEVRDAIRYANALTGDTGCDVDEEDHDDNDDGDDDDADRDDCDEAPDDAADRERSATEDAESDRTATGDASLDELEAEAMAMIDGEVDEDAIRTGLAFASATFDDATALRDMGERHHGPSRWGRLDLTVAWRRAWSLSRTDERSDALWLLATWRR